MQKHQLSIILTGIALLTFGLVAFFVWAQPTLANSEASVNWPKVSGQVLTSKMVQTRVRRRRQKRNVRVTKYHPEVVFKYEVDGQIYSSSNISFGIVTDSRSPVRAKEVLAKYPVGSYVNVFYNPAAPETSTLQPGAKPISYVYFWGSLVVAALGLVLVISPSVFNNAIEYHFNSTANDFSHGSSDGRRQDLTTGY